MNVCIFADGANHRSVRIADAMHEGALRMGWKVEMTREPHVTPRADMLLAYGWRNRSMFEAYRKAGLHYIFVDLGYWNRKRARSDYGGNHKVVLDAKHATRYFRRNRPHDRLAGAPAIKPWNMAGKNIVIAGLSAKSAAGAGLRPLAWEYDIIAKLKRITKRNIVYRPKPSWRDARPIAGTVFSSGEQTIEDALRDAHALVALDSNAAIDALAAGVVVYAVDGLASVMSMRSLDDIETAPRNGDREQFFADVSYCHYTRQEIASGRTFAQFVDDGLI